MAEPHPQVSFAKKEKESDDYSDDMGIEDLLDTVTIESDQRAVGRGRTSRVSSPNVFPASNSSRPNRRLFFDDEDQVRTLE